VGPRTVLFSCHDLNLARRFATHALLLDGRGLRPLPGDALVAADCNAAPAEAGRSELDSMAVTAAAARDKPTRCARVDCFKLAHPSMSIHVGMPRALSSPPTALTSSWASHWSVTGGSSSVRSFHTGHEAWHMLSTGRREGEEGHTG
jgi:hypothetical protein